MPKTRPNENLMAVRERERESYTLMKKTVVQF